MRRFGSGCDSFSSLSSCNGRSSHAQPSTGAQAPFNHTFALAYIARCLLSTHYMAMVGASLIAVGYLGNCISGLVLAYITAMAAIVYPAASANGLIAGVCERVSAVVSPIIDKLRIIVNRTRGIAPDAHHDVRPRKPSKAD
eukprot:Opistho-2@58516